MKRVFTGRELAAILTECAKSVVNETSTAKAMRVGRERLRRYNDVMFKGEDSPYYDSFVRHGFAYKDGAGVMQDGGALERSMKTVDDTSRRNLERELGLDKNTNWADRENGEFDMKVSSGKPEVSFSTKKSYDRQKGKYIIDKRKTYSYDGKGRPMMTDYNDYDGSMSSVMGHPTADARMRKAVDYLHRVHDEDAEDEGIMNEAIQRYLRQAVSEINEQVSK